MSGDPAGVSLNATVGVTNPGNGGAQSPRVAQMTAVDVLGRVDELPDGTGGSVDAVMGAAVGPYRKSRLTGLRMAMAHPERVTAIVSQNGNAYEEGLGDVWAPIRRYWREPTSQNREAVRKELSPEGIRTQYIYGVPNPAAIAPEGYTLDAAMIGRPGNMEIQLDLLLDYANNVKLYPAFHQYFRQAQPPLLAIWGKHDPFFIPAGAEAFRRDIPNADVQFLDTGHFATETHVVEIAAAMRDFLDANGV